MATSKRKPPKSKSKAPKAPKTKAPKRLSKIARIVRDVVSDMKKAERKKKEAKKKTTTTRREREVTTEQLAMLALAGDVDGLGGLLGDAAYVDYDAARQLYKWLLVAADFARTARQRAAAERASDDVLNNSVLHTDDDHFAEAEAHWELGIAYLTATEGLPRHLERSRRELARAKQQNWPFSMADSTKLLASARKQLDAEALAVFDSVYDGTK